MGAEVPVKPTTYDAEELALLRAGLDDADPDERGATAGLLLRQPTTDHQVRARLQQLLSDHSVVALPHPGAKGELRVLAGLALARAARLAGEDDAVPLRAAPAVQGPWVPLPERDMVLRGDTAVHELMENPPITARPQPARPAEAADAWRGDLDSADLGTRVNALRTIMDRPTGDPGVVAMLEAMVDDRRIAALTIPYRFGEIRVLAGSALAAERASVGDPRPVRLESCPALLGTDQLRALAESHGINVTGRAEPEVYVALRDAGILPLGDLELTGPTYLGWLG
jgi:hypothetical protein